MFSSTKQTTCVETKTVPTRPQELPRDGFCVNGPAPATHIWRRLPSKAGASERAGQVSGAQGGSPAPTRWPAVSERGVVLRIRRVHVVGKHIGSLSALEVPVRGVRGRRFPSVVYVPLRRTSRGGGGGGGRRPRKPSRGKESERKTHRRHEEEPKKKSRKKSRKEPTCNQRVCAGNPKTRSSREKKTQRRSRKREDVEGSRQLGPEPRTLRGGSPQRRGGAFSGPGTLVPFCPVHAYLPRVESLPAGHEDDHVANTSSVGDTDAGSIHAVAPSPARAPRTFPGL